LLIDRDPQALLSQCLGSRSASLRRRLRCDARGRRPGQGDTGSSCARPLGAVRVYIRTYGYRRLKATNREMSHKPTIPRNNTPTRVGLRHQGLCAPPRTSWLPAGRFALASFSVVFSRVSRGSEGASNSSDRRVRAARMLSRRRISSVLVSNSRRRNSMSSCCTCTSRSMDASLDSSCIISDESRYTYMRPSGSWS
jgi:hypothetical protein